MIAPVSDFLGYPNPNKDGMTRVSPAIRDNHDLSPSDAQLKTLYATEPLPQKAERVRTRAWTKIKSGS